MVIQYFVYFFMSDYFMSTWASFYINYNPATETSDDMDSPISQTLDHYMLLFMLITIARLYKAQLGFEYIYQQKFKPKRNKAFYANLKENDEAINMEDFKFQNWNREMRIRLERYFRLTANITIAYII